MADPAQARGPIRFGAFQVDLSAGELRKNGLKIRLPEQSFQILVMLTENPGKVVGRDELRKRLWPADTFVDFDDGLNSAVLRLRNALGDSAEMPRFVETVPRRGYRFIAPVEGAPPPARLPADEAPTTQKEKPKIGRRLAGKPLLAGATLLVFLVALVVLDVGSVRERFWQTSPPRIRSLAVLPLENLTGDPTQEYFADGMTDALITDLAQIGALRVISRTSVMRYKGARKPLREIAHELHVEGVVEGTIARSGERVRVDAQLIEAETDRHVWARSYERNIRDVITLQSEVAQAIAREIAVKLTPQEQARLAKSQPLNPAAYEDYLRGRFYWSKRNEESLRKAIESFERAIAEDPSYAPPYAWLASCYSSLAMFDQMPPAEAMPKAREAGRRALALDDTLAESYTWLATVSVFYDWNWAEGEKQYQRAIELDPGNAVAHQAYSLFLSYMGRAEEALREIRRAQELDPVSLRINTSAALRFLLAGQLDQAERQLRKTLELDAAYADAHRKLGEVYALKGMYSQAISEMQQAVELSRRNPEMVASLGCVLGASGQRQQARLILAELQQRSSQRYVSPWEQAKVHAGLGERNQAIEWLDRAYAERTPKLVGLNVEPAFASLQADPRFGALVRRMGLPARDQ